MIVEQDVPEVVPEPEVKDVNEVEVTSPEPIEETVPSTPEVKPEVHDNRPIENVAWETKRKLDEIVPSLQNEIRELKTYIQSSQAPKQPTYSKAQLQAYASEPTTTTEQRLWAYTEVDKLEKADREQEYERLVKTTQTRTESESRRSQAANWVSQTFPETIIKDGNGNTVGWNNNSPLLAKANEYMHRSETLRADPEGFMAAVKMAAFDLGVSTNLSKKIDKTVGLLRKEQKKQLASSGGTRIPDSPETASKTRLSKLQDEYAKTGNKDAFAEIIKARGINPYV
jgi:hypothetical protein